MRRSRQAGKRKPEESEHKGGIMAGPDGERLTAAETKIEILTSDMVYIKAGIDTITKKLDGFVVKQSYLKGWIGGGIAGITLITGVLGFILYLTP